MAVHQLKPVSHGLRNRPPAVQPFFRRPLARHAEATGQGRRIPTQRVENFAQPFRGHRRPRLAEHESDACFWHLVTMQRDAIAT